MGYVRLLCSCMRERVFILLYWCAFIRDKQLKKSIQRKINWDTVSKDYQWSSYPSGWWGSVSLYVHASDGKHVNQFVTPMSSNFCIWRLLPVGSPASFRTFCFSMDVQGDYDPCDASGFIRINAVRLAFTLKSKNGCLLKPAHTYASSFFIYFSSAG